MSDFTHPTANQTAARELKVSIRPHGSEYWVFEGSRAQLEAEGVIPPDMKWPEGTQRCYWESGRFSYWLRRTRPDDLRGPMKLWTNGDWWCLRCEFDDGLSDASRNILQKRRELTKEIYRHSFAGWHEENTRLDRYWQARRDKAFQVFKSIVFPEQKKPGRPAKIRSQSVVSGDQA